VQNVTQNTQKAQMTLEAYNPFAQNNTVVSIIFQFLKINKNKNFTV
jgi:hypothetical protein